MYKETPVSPCENYGPQFDGTPEDEYGDRRMAIVVCSGGLDSTTAATIACHDCTDVLLLHFLYGCKAESTEKTAVMRIGMALNEKFNARVKWTFVPLNFLREIGGSVLTDVNLHSHIASGERGESTHNAWVPARNMVMLSIAAAYCDRFRFGRIYLGTNKEEAEGGKFPDNSSEFIDAMDSALQYGAVSKPEIIAPLRHCMKIDIVKKALEYRAPIHLSHSCYHPYPCDNIETACGPCRMRLRSLEQVGVTLDTFKQFYNDGDAWGK